MATSALSVLLPSRLRLAELPLLVSGFCRPMQRTSNWLRFFLTRFADKLSWAKKSQVHSSMHAQMKISPHGGRIQIPP